MQQDDVRSALNRTTLLVADVEKAREAGAPVIAPPTDREVTAPGGAGRFPMRTMTCPDPGGVYPGFFSRRPDQQSAT